MDAFTEVWTKIKEIHDREVQGLRAKLTELNVERCLDSQQLEELFAKNHQLREQQKILNENVKILENRLRAGLCDRCTVTQELARKKQQEFETAQLQGFRHISLLNCEINRLKEENTLLQVDLRKLKCFLEERKKQVQSWETLFLSDTNVHVGSSSHYRRNQSSNSNFSLQSNHQRDEQELRHFTEGSPTPSIHSPNCHFPDSPVFDVHPQRISNHLHGTIALITEGKRCPSCPEQDQATNSCAELQEQSHSKDALHCFSPCRKDGNSTEEPEMMKHPNTGAYHDTGDLNKKKEEPTAEDVMEKPLDLSDCSKNKGSLQSTSKDELFLKPETKKPRLKEPQHKKCLMGGKSLNVKSQNNMYCFETDTKVARYNSKTGSREAEDDSRMKMNLRPIDPKAENVGSQRVEVHLQILKMPSDPYETTPYKITEFQDVQENQEIKSESVKGESEKSEAQLKKRKRNECSTIGLQHHTREDEGPKDPNQNQSPHIPHNPAQKFWTAAYPASQI
uniref:DNA endonuclease Ctp1 N-terminal domain-containing protein n=1 Tax=Callorhinchus milii TaxID=7868 RepID=A0A4W3J1H2_CALMI|eukprot:gi/632939691/ref/XP_007882816.1/ PREDICTED: RBBP8 N-terminal-like protein isoform X1 [Callorhinchus milii]